MNNKKLGLRITVINTVTYIMTFYFIFHIFSGDRGVFAYLNFSKKIIETKAEVKKLYNHKNKLEHKARLINYKKPDIDYLDELARHNFNYAKKNESVLIIQ